MFSITRKFFLAFLGLVGSFALAEQHLVSGSEWVAVVTLILTVHGTANVVDKKLGGAG
jgi:hypothetical protein